MIAQQMRYLLCTWLTHIQSLASHMVSWVFQEHFLNTEPGVTYVHLRCNTKTKKRGRWKEEEWIDEWMVDE